MSYLIEYGYIFLKNCSDSVLFLRSVMTWTLLHFTVICWLGIASRTCWDALGYFLPIPRIQTLVLFLYGKEWFHGLLFFDWEIYDMLWCSHYCATIPIGVPPGGKLTWPSNISSLMKVWSERSIFNVGRMEVFVSSIISEPGDHPLLNLLLCSSKI